MLSTVGNPVAVNPDSTLRAHARDNSWVIRDFRRRAQIKEYSAPGLSAFGGIALGLTIGYAVGRRRR